MKAINILYHSLLGSLILMITIVRILTGAVPPPSRERRTTTQKISKPVAA